MATTPLGIPDRLRPEIQQTLADLSISDFGHDFGGTYIYSLLNEVSLSTKLSNVQRAKNVANIINEIAGRVTTAKKAGTRTTVNTWNLYQHFGKDIQDTVFPRGKTGDKSDEVGSVNQILNRTTMQAIKDHFIRDTKPDPMSIDIQSHENPSRINRKYTVTAVRFKFGKRPEQNRTISEVFNEITGGKTEFAIMEDASTIPMSEITTIERFSDPQKDKRTFYVIKSTENESDSANKVTSYSTDTENVNKIFLKDTDTVNIYPSFNAEGVLGNNAAVYTDVNFRAQRNENGEIDGTYTLADGSEVEIPNLSESSKIAKTAVKVMETYIDNYAEYARGENVKRKVCLYFPVKKFGDWCQALCLLDTSRSYEQKDEDDNVIAEKITLSDIAKNGEVGVLTGDQILLAYSLLIGVNAFFTVKVRPPADEVEATPDKKKAHLRQEATLYDSASPKNKKTVAGKRVQKPTKEGDGEHSDHWLFFFKNNDGLDETPLKKPEILEIQDKLARLVKNLNDNLGEITGPVEKASRPSAIILNGTVKNSIISYINELRNKGRILSSVSTEDVTAIINEVTSMRDALNGAGPHLKRNFRVDLLEKRVDGLIAQNNATLKLGLSPEEKETTSGVVDSIFTEKLLADTTAFQRFLSTVLYPIRDDFKNKQVQIPRITSLVAAGDTLLMSPGGRESRVRQSNQKKFIYTLNDVFSAFLPKAGGVRLANTLDQQKAQLKEAFYKIRLRSILIVKTKKGLAAAAGRENTQRRCGSYRENSKFAGEMSDVARELFPATAPQAAEKCLSVVDATRDVKGSEYYIALVENYVLDRNGNYCSVLDNYIVTIDECSTFITVKDDACDVIKTSVIVDLVENNSKKQKDFIANIEKDENYLLMLNYLYYRFLLLRHDILYTKYRELELEQNTEEIRKLRENVLTLSGDIQAEAGKTGVVYTNLQRREDSDTTLRALQRDATAKRASAKKAAADLNRWSASKNGTLAQRQIRIREEQLKAEGEESEAAKAEDLANQYELLTLNFIKKLLNEIRCFIFKSYWNKNGGKESLRERLIKYEDTERAAVGQNDPSIQRAIADQKDDIKVAEKIINALECAVDAAAVDTEAAGGYRRYRKTRKAKKSKRRQTRRR